MKIILSRKGFDAACGGVPSPILPDGALLSLPIPRGDAPVSFGVLHFKGHAVGTVVEDLTRGRIGRDHPTHLDPDLHRPMLPRPRDWRPLFGQAGAAQTHLARAGVGAGDLFLFFGYFRQVEAVDGHYRYVRHAPPLHVIYGYLQVGAVVRLHEQRHEAPAWASEHPHLHGQFLHNTLYVSREQLQLDGQALPLAGAGIMEHVHPDLVLTAPDHGRATWLLPSWFWPGEDRTPLSYHGDERRWSQTDAGVVLRSAAQGQEFILDADHYPEATTWARGLLDATMP